MRYLNDEELTIATRFIFLSMAITVLEQDIQHIQDGSFKIKEPYLDMLRKMIYEALNERKQLRTKMKRGNIRATLLERNDLFSSFLFLCHGREEKRNYFNPAIKQRVKVIIQELLIVAQKEAMKIPQPDLNDTSSALED